MAVDNELQGFVRDALARSVSRADIKNVLVRAGWDSEQVRAALAAFAEVDFPVPVPRPQPYVSAREAFLYLALFTTLYVCAFNLGSLLFAFVDRAFPNPAAAGRALEATRTAAIRWPTSWLIVAPFPFSCTCPG